MEVEERRKRKRKSSTMELEQSSLSLQPDDDDNDDELKKKKKKKKKNKVVNHIDEEEEQEQQEEHQHEQQQLEDVHLEGQQQELCHNKKKKNKHKKQKHAATTIEDDDEQQQHVFVKIEENTIDHQMDETNEHHQEQEQQEKLYQKKKKKKKKKHKDKNVEEEEEDQEQMMAVMDDEPQQNDDQQPDHQQEEEYQQKKKKKKKKHKHDKLDEIDEQESNERTNEKIVNGDGGDRDGEEITRLENEINYIDLDSQSNELPRENANRIVMNDDTILSTASLHLLIPKLYNFNENDYELLRQHGITMRTGRFTAAENDQLQRNWDRYLRDYVVPNPRYLLGHFARGTNRSLKAYYQLFALRTKLIFRLAKGIDQRSLNQIYHRARTMLSGLRSAATFTPDDRDRIIQLYRTYGDDYAKFCEHYGYDPKAAREVVRNTVKANGKRLRSGKWSDEELEQLSRNVKRVMRQFNLRTYDRIPWSVVAADMCRSDTQCRQRFFSKAVFFMQRDQLEGYDSGGDGSGDGDGSGKTLINDGTTTNSSTTIKWDSQLDMAKLIVLLLRCEFANENDIDWDFVKEKFSLDCFNILRREWRRARSQVPDLEHKSLAEILDYLYQNRVWKLYQVDKIAKRQIKQFIRKCFE